MRLRPEALAQDAPLKTLAKAVLFGRARPERLAECGFEPSNLKFAIGSGATVRRRKDTGGRAKIK
jgi:hypothetical protein